MRFYIPFELPSGGKVINPYKGYIGDAEGLEQLERATPGIGQDQLIAELIQKALKEKYWDVKDLTAPDFTYLKIMYSMATYGNKLLYPVICPFCGVENKYISLKDLKSVPYNEDWEKVKIPSKEECRDFYNRDGDELELRVPSVKEKWEILLEGDTAYATKLGLMGCIKKVNDNILSSLDKERYVQELSMAQKRVILASLDKLADFGIAMYQDLNCECGKTVSYPFSVQTRQLYLPRLG